MAGNEASNFFRAYKRFLSVDLHTLIIAKIVSYDSNLERASVKPLPLIKGIDVPVIDNLPILIQGNNDWTVHVPYNVDDIVAVAFFEHDADNILLGTTETDVNTERDHSFDDGLIIGKINLFTNNLSLPSDEIIIKHKTSDAGVTINSSGEITVNGTNIKLGNSATEFAALGTSLKSWLDAHTHGGGSTPDTSSPNPSTKVRIE